MRESRSISEQLTTLSLAILVPLSLIVVPRLASVQAKPNTEGAISSRSTSTNLVPPPNDNFNNATGVFFTFGEIPQTTIDATVEVGEPNHAGNPGGHSVWFSWTNTESYTVGRTFSTRHNSTNFDTLLAVYTGTSVNALTEIASSDDYGIAPSHTSTVYFAAAPGTTYYIAVDGFGGVSGNFFFRWDLNRTHGQSNKFAGTGQSAVSVFRPSNGAWYTNSDNGFQAVQFGLNGDIPAPADFDGDGGTDYAVFRQSSGTWYILYSSTNTFHAELWGQNGDKPVPGDYGTHGLASYAVFRPSNGTWYIKGIDVNKALQFGQIGDQPVPRDFDLDGTLDLAVFRPSTGTWYILNSRDNSFTYQQWGANGDVPIPGAFAPTGRADIAVWRPSSGTWYVYLSHNNQYIAKPFGQNGDLPQPINYGVNTGQSDYCVFRPSTGTWYILDSSTGQFSAVQFGASGDIPASTAYVVGQ